MKKLILVLIIIYLGVVVVHYKSTDTIVNNAVNKQSTFNNNSEYILFIDLDKPIFLPRLYLINSKTKKIEKSDFIFTSFKSGIIYSNKFSNTPNTNLTSIGSFIVGEQYNGDFGYSVRIKGLEPHNNNVYKRTIVLHPWNGFPYTLGCYSTFETTLKHIIPLIQNGGFMIVED
jgi:hypothetical protein